MQRSLQRNVRSICALSGTPNSSAFWFISCIRVMGPPAAIVAPASSRQVDLRQVLWFRFIVCRLEAGATALSRYWLVRHHEDAAGGKVLDQAFRVLQGNARLDVKDRAHL